MEDFPFSPKGAPVSLLVPCMPVTWESCDGCAAPLPASRTAVGPVEIKRFLPYGCTNLRMTLASLPSEITDPKEASFRLSPGMPLFYRKAANWKKHFHNFEVAFKIFKYNLNFKKILPILKIKIIQQSCKI